MFVPGLAVGMLLVLLGDDFTRLSGLENITEFLLLSGLLGLLVRVFYPFANEFLYGAFWPTQLRRKAILSLQEELRRAERLIGEPARDPSTKEGLRQAQARGFVYLFPFDVAGNRFVVAPTLVGNIWASLVSFLQLQYGLHLIGSLGIDRHMAFVFMRLWFLLERNVRQEISEAIAIYEALVGVIVAVSFGIFAFFAQGIWRGVVEGSWGNARLPLVIALSLLLLARLLYRVLLREAVGAVVAFEALFGRLSRGDLDRLIEEARKAIEAQTSKSRQNPR